MQKQRNKNVYKNETFLFRRACTRFLHVFAKFGSKNAKGKKRQNGKKRRLQAVCKRQRKTKEKERKGCNSFMIIIHLQQKPHTYAVFVDVNSFIHVFYTILFKTCTARSSSRGYKCE